MAFNDTANTISAQIEDALRRVAAVETILASSPAIYQPLAAILTDLSAVSPSQGDILYYNGTSWVRLAAGTSGKFLMTNGAGANPSWETVVVGP